MPRFARDRFGEPRTRVLRCGLRAQLPLTPICPTNRQPRRFPSLKIDSLRRRKQPKNPSLHVEDIALAGQFRRARGANLQLLSCHRIVGGYHIAQILNHQLPTVEMDRNSRPARHDPRARSLALCIHARDQRPIMILDGYLACRVHGGVGALSRIFDGSRCIGWGGRLLDHGRFRSRGVLTSHNRHDKRHCPQKF